MAVSFGAIPRPIILGIVGDSAAGKTTLSRGIAEILGTEQVSVLCTDDYHRYNRQQRKELGITPLNPECNYLDIMAQHLRLLRAGEPILKPHYEHKLGDFGPPQYIVPRPILIVEGLLGFYWQEMRNAYSVRVYLNPPEDLRRRWKVRRDSTKRGYSEQEVLRELDIREADSSAFIRPQRASADIVVRFAPIPGRADAAPGVLSWMRKPQDRLAGGRAVTPHHIGADAVDGAVHGRTPHDIVHRAPLCRTETILRAHAGDDGAARQGAGPALLPAFRRGGAGLNPAVRGAAVGGLALRCPPPIAAAVGEGSMAIAFVHHYLREIAAAKSA